MVRQRVALRTTSDGQYGSFSGSSRIAAFDDRIIDMFPITGPEVKT